MLKTALQKEKLTKIRDINKLEECWDAVQEEQGSSSTAKSSQPEPVAGVDPLTHFLSPSPAPRQGEPLVEEKKGKQERARNQRLKGGKEKERSC